MSNRPPVATNDQGGKALAKAEARTGGGVRPSLEAILDRMDLRGVNVAAVNTELDSFVHETQPVNLSSGMLVTNRCKPACGREKALAAAERVRPILLRLNPDWEQENEFDGDFEFRQIRDACQRLRARLDSHQEVEALLGDDDAAPQLSAGALHELVWKAASAQWQTGHRHEAVLAATKAVNSQLQAKLGRRDVSEVRLVQEAFGEKAGTADRPRLRFTSVLDEQTRESLQQGVLSFGVGCFQAIRNPVGHLPNEEVELSEQAALERLAALSLFAGWIDEATLATD